MVIFHSKLLVYQRVTPCLTAEKTLFRGGWIEFFPHFFMDKSTTTVDRFLGNFHGADPAEPNDVEHHREFIGNSYIFCAFFHIYVALP